MAMEELHRALEEVESQGLGVLDSGRSDVQYEDFEGHKPDRKLLELLQRY